MILFTINPEDVSVTDETSTIFSPKTYLPSNFPGFLKQTKVIASNSKK